MWRLLTLHPDSLCAAVTRIETQATRAAAGRLTLRYRVNGAVTDLVLPARTAPDRADGLWRHSCLEAFIGAPGDEAYVEFNLAPSTRWAAYRFDRYRQGMRPADMAGDPRIEVSLTDDRLELTATVAVPIEGPWRIGLSAVIEEAGGRISYWALAHPPGKPDFHHALGHVLDLPATERP